MEWIKLGVSQELAQAISKAFGFNSPTPVQKAGIPYFLGNKDICVESCTGSGKTLTFLIPIFEKILREERPFPFALVISPSRELAQQTFAVTKVLSEVVTKVDAQCLIGGHDKAGDILDLEQGKGILIGTPGRILDLLRTGDMNLKTIEVLILDEADRLLDMGFKDTIDEIISSIPKHRRTGLFSATMNTDVQHLIKAGLRNPVYISIKVQNKAQDLPQGLKNYYSLFSSYYFKLPALIRFLVKYSDHKIIVFFGTCASTNFYLHLLENLSLLKNFSFFRMHGKMKQNQREKVYQEFIQSTSGVLLSTDLLARGIDFLDVKWIVQFDPPQNPDFFVHRIGRTARANRTGNSLIFLNQNEDAYLNYLNLKSITLKQKKLNTDFGVYKEAQEIITKDREAYEKAQAAFVGYLRYYKEHQLSYIFQLKNLDLGFLAQGFCLLRIPRVKEILGKKIENFEQGSRNPEDIEYSDERREAKRQRLLEEKVRMLEQKKKDKMKKKNKCKNQRPRSRSEKREAKREAMKEDFDDLGREEKIIKKIRKGKTSDPEVQEYLQENPHVRTLFRKKKH